MFVAISSLIKLFKISDLSHNRELLARCEPCFKFYVQQAVKLGATEHELGEVLAAASTMSGCVGEMWALKAYKDFSSGEAAPEAGPSCCQ